MNIFCFPFAVMADNPIVELTNHQSGISLSLSGTNGTDWAVEQTFHDEVNADLILFVKSNVDFSFAHNENNTLVNIYAPNRLIGADGLDGVPDSGDEGIIHYKIDRDQQAHSYTGILPSWLPVYSSSFNFNALTYDGSLHVLGTTGDNGGAWASPRYNTNRFYYGMNDSFSNEWHVVTYWDDDVTLLTNAHINVHRQGASDGHCVEVCVNPLTPVIQFKATGSEQFYTTPVKTYHIPKIWRQTTYLTSGVQINFVNLTNSDAVQYSVDGGNFQDYEGTPILASSLFGGSNTTHALRVRCGSEGVVCSRDIVYQPDYPGASETHGYLLWKDETEKQEVTNKIKNVQPFKYSYSTYKGNWYQGLPVSFSDARNGWCSGASMAGNALANAFVVAIEGPSNASVNAAAAKTRLLRMARIKPVGTDIDIDAQSPSKDFLNELGQTLELFADAGVAYDLMAGFCRQSQYSGGLTPVEEYKIRDGLAKIVTTVLGRMHESYSATIGGGDTHWAHGYELMAGMMSLAMPTYKNNYYGTSGGDRVSTNDLVDSNGKYWNPYPDQGVTWYQVATDPMINALGYPDVKYPFRAEFLLSDDGWWTGPNDFQGDGDRYFTGPSGSKLVDVPYGGLANAECRNELTEMYGYENAFVERLYIFNAMRKMKGDKNLPLCINNYMQRRIVNGVVMLSYSTNTNTYTLENPNVATAIYGFNKYFNFASLPAARNNITTFLNNLNIYYGYQSGTLDDATRSRISDSERKYLYDAYSLAFCADPALLPSATAPLGQPPVIKPLMKYVIKPGTIISKNIIAYDLNGDEVTVTVQDLPVGASYDPALRRITWTPNASDEGVHIITVNASNNICMTTRPFPIIVKLNAGSGPIPAAAPLNFTANLADKNTAVELTWEPPSGVSNIHSYFLYRDGIFFKTLAAGITKYVDTEYVFCKTHTRYHISYINSSGAESGAVEAKNGYITVPLQNVPFIPLLSDITKLEGEKIEFDIKVRDANPAHILTLGATGMPDGSTLSKIKERTWRFSWQTDFNDANSNTIVFTAFDGQENSESVTVNITVNELSTNLQLTDHKDWN